MESDAPGASSVEDLTGLISVKSTTSPERMELPPTPPRSRRRGSRSYSSIIGSDEELLPPSNTKPQITISSDPPDNGGQFEPTCNLAVLTKARRKEIVNGINQLRDHDKPLKSLLFPERGLVTCGPKHAVAITWHPSAF